MGMEAGKEKHGDKGTRSKKMEDRYGYGSRKRKTRRQGDWPPHLCKVRGGYGSAA